MKYMTINNRKVAFDNEKNVLAVIRKAGIELPTFCYLSELSTYGACRMSIFPSFPHTARAECALWRTIGAKSSHHVRRSLRTAW